jgi:hypothetical protein
MFKIDQGLQAKFQEIVAGVAVPVGNEADAARAAIDGVIVRNDRLSEVISYWT